VSITRAFSDSNVERVVLQSSLQHADGARSLICASPPRSFKWLRRAGGIRACESVGSHGDPFATLGLNAAASKQDIKHAYRKLALQYHPDVCKGDHCTLMFKQVKNAYEVALEVEEQEVVAEVRSETLDGFMGATDDNWEEWEEWMGWEGAGTTDYSSHVNPSYSF